MTPTDPSPEPTTADATPPADTGPADGGPADGGATGGTSDGGSPPPAAPVAPDEVRPPAGDDADGAAGEDDGRSSVSHPTKLLRIASMARALLEEARRAPLDEEGRRLLLEIYERTLKELGEIVSADLRHELEEIFVPLDGTVPSESELRIAQAQLVGWLEGLFHGIQASIASQQLAAQQQLEEMRRQAALARQQQEKPDREYPGVYL